MKTQNNQYHLSGMSMARPVLNAMKVDAVHDIHSKKGLFSELDSDYQSESQTCNKPKFAPSFSSDEIRLRRNKSGAFSLSSHFSMRIVQNLREYEEEFTSKFDSCCEKDSAFECLLSSQRPFLRNTLKASLIKFLLALISTRSIVKTMEQLKYAVPKFGATFGFAGAFFHLTICCLRRLGKRSGQKWFLNMSERKACFIAACACALPIVFGLQKSELNLAKLVFFPLAWRCISNKLLEVGFVPKFKGGDVLAYMLVGFVVTYAYMLESSSL